MRAALVALLFAASAFAQAQSTVSAAGCPGDVSFKVHLDNARHTLAQPQKGKALIYFIHDAGADNGIAYPTVKIGLDGAWVGANHGDSYFSVSVSTGEHHVCATLQSSMVDQRVELAHFTAESGQVYFCRTRLLLSRAIELLELDRIDSDQGAYLIASYPLSVSHPKKY
jgi:hypothetical protein